MSPSGRSSKSAPANFLTLPREIRQKILYEPFDDACEHDSRFSINVNLPDCHLGRKVSVPHFLPQIHDHMSTLYSIHRTINEDMEFVVKQVLASFQGVYNQVVAKEEYVQKFGRWHTLATKFDAWEYLDEDYEAVHHRRFTMVQMIREAIGADTSQFSFNVEALD